MRARTLAAGLAAACAVVGAAATPAAADGRTETTRGEVTFPAQPAVECDGGAVIGLTFDVRYTDHVTTDASGAIVARRLTLGYVGAFVDLGTGARSEAVRGAGTSSFDLVAGTHTVSGSQRSLTVPGAGKVLHEAGHAVMDLESGALLSQHGPLRGETTAEGARAVCAAMGRTGGRSLS